MNDREEVPFLAKAMFGFIIGFIAAYICNRMGLNIMIIGSE